LNFNYRTYKKSFKSPEGETWSFTYRGLTSAETTRLPKIEDELKKQDFILSRAVLNWEQQGEVPDGVKESLAFAVIKASALGQDSSIKARAEEWLLSQKGKLELLTIRMFPTLTLEYLDNCDPLIYEKYRTATIFLAPSMQIDLIEYLGIKEKPEETHTKDQEFGSRRPREITEEERTQTLKNMKLK